MRFDVKIKLKLNRFTSCYKKEKKNSAQSSNFVFLGSFSSDIKAVKGLKEI